MVSLGQPLRPARRKEEKDSCLDNKKAGKGRSVKKRMVCQLFWTVQAQGQREGAGNRSAPRRRKKERKSSSGLFLPVGKEYGRT